MNAKPKSKVVRKAKIETKKNIQPTKEHSINSPVRRLLKAGAESQLFAYSSSSDAQKVQKIKKAESRDLKVSPDSNQQLYRIKPRLSKNAIEATSIVVSNYIQALGKECLLLTQHSRQKTISSDCLFYIASIAGGKCSFKGSGEALRYCSGMALPQKKKDVKISFSAIKRELGKVMRLEKSNNENQNLEVVRVSADAKVYFVHLIETYIRLIGARAILFTHSAKRETIKTEDINKAMLCL